MKRVYSLLLILLAYGQISAQCLQLQNCLSTADACDYTINDATLWNETYWYDPVNQTQNLSDTPVEATLTVTDDCAGATVTMRYLLFLDLDKNGSWETVVKSWEPPAPGTVNFNNANNPNYDGGDVRVFDERAVPASGKYQFALETITNGNSTQANLRWNTPAAPNTFVIPELPYATHKIKWLASDDLGNDQVCEQNIVVKDCKRPTVVCINGLSVNLMPTGQITIWASDFLQYGEDNATPTPHLKYGARKCGTGTGFPWNPDGTPQNSVIFSCSEIGTQCVELWAIDASGNADFCETYVIVQDNLGNCGGSAGAAPVVTCLNGLSVNLLPSAQIELFASDFLLSASDDNTPANLLEFGVQSCGAGSVFPEDGSGQGIDPIVFDCDDRGTQCVELWVRDEDGNTNFCLLQVIVQDNFEFCPGNNDTQAPTIVCLNGLSVNLMPTGQIMLWASDFLQYAEDNQTPTPQLQLSIRKSGTGTGFPLDSLGNTIPSVTYDCTELGTQVIELWVKDLDGNTEYCETYVIVQDNLEVCSGGILLDTHSADDAISILAPLPNPTAAGAQIPVRLNQAGAVKLELSDLSGKMLWQNESELNAGSHLLEINANAMPQTGVYIWRIKAGAKSVSGKLVRI